MVTVAGLKKLEAKAKRERWEAELLKQIRAAKIETPEREYKFDTRNGRQWRFDFAWPYKRIAAEVNGGVNMPGGGRHNREIGKDGEKRNEAQLQGWDVYEFTPDQIKSGYALNVIEEAIAEYESITL